MKDDRKDEEISSVMHEERRRGRRPRDAAAEKLRKEQMEAVREILHLRRLYWSYPRARARRRPGRACERREDLAGFRFFKEAMNFFRLRNFLACCCGV